MGKIVCCTLEFLCKRSGVIMHLLRKEVAHKSVIDNTCSKQCLTLMIEDGFETFLDNKYKPLIYVLKRFNAKEQDNEIR